MDKTKPSLVPILLTALCAIAAGYVGVVDSGQAACAAVRPSLKASLAQAAPGEPFRLHGEGFYGDFICDDTDPPVWSRPAGSRPTDGIRVEILQGTKTWTLATMSSGEGLEFDAEGLTVPADATPGRPSSGPQAPPSTHACPRPGPRRRSWCSTASRRREARGLLRWRTIGKVTSPRRYV